MSSRVSLDFLTMSVKYCSVSASLFGTPSLHVFAPLLDLPGRALVLRGLVDPVENLTVAFTGREFFAQRRRIDSDEVDEVLIKRAIVVILAALTRDLRAPFVEHAGQEHVTASRMRGLRGGRFVRSGAEMLWLSW